ASFRGGRLRAGSLDPLIREFLARPPKPNAAKPQITIDRGLLLLDTDYGPLRLSANARVNDGRLQALAATSAPAALHGATFDAALAAADVAWTRKGGDRVAGTVRVNATGADLAAGDLTLQTVTVALGGPVSASTRASEGRLAGSVVGHGRWSGFGPPAALDQG